MPKKIYDVMPPDVANKVENTVKSLGTKTTRKRSSPRMTKTEKIVRVEKKQATYYQPPTPPPQLRRRFPLMELTVGFSIIVILLGVYLYNKLPMAEISILPALETISLEDKITADKSFSTVDLSAKTVPLKVLESEKEASQEFPATGNASNDGKSSGTITIYNKVSPAMPISLKVGTHFLSDSGKYFIILSKVTVPAMKGKVPGSINVKVEAEQAGEDYNIGASKFSVPKLSGTSYYYNIWGESKEAMSGGHIGTVKKVTRDDLDSAKDVLTDKLFEDAKSELMAKISDQEVLLDGSVENKLISSSASAKADAIASNFTQSVKVKVVGLVLAKKDLENYAKGKFLSKIPVDKELLLESLDLKYDADSSDLDKGSAKINLHASIKNYYSIDTEDLTHLFVGKTPDQVMAALDEQYDGKISGVETSLWPFWVTSVPKNRDKVKINLNFK